jgi:hypothetical protein
LEVGGEAYWTELAVGSPEKILGQSRYSGNDRAIGSANERKFVRRAESCAGFCEFPSEEENAFLEPSKIIRQRFGGPKFQ